MNSTLKLSEAGEKFANFLKEQGRSSNTIVAYQGDINQLVRFLNGQAIESIPEVEESHLEEFKKSLEKENYTPKSISRKLNSIKGFFAFLVNEGVIEKNLSRNIKHPKISNDLPRILSALEYRALRDSCRHDTRTLTIVELMLQVGLRISEVANLHLEDINNGTLTIRSYETHPERKVPLNKSAREAVENYLAERETGKNKYLFVTKTGRQLLVRNIRSVLNRYFERAGLKDVKVNDLRNTFVSEQLAAGVPLDIISRIVGHKRLSTTERYLSLTKDSKDSEVKLKEL
ncbi:MAG: tyrosine-type recombinase/integrase [Patescibacteria group bacterium]